MRPPDESVRVEIRDCSDADRDRIRSILRKMPRAVTVEDGVPRPADRVPLLVIGPNDEGAMIDAIENGAMGYVVASSTEEDISTAVEVLSNGSAIIPPMMLGALLRHTVQRRERTAAIQEKLGVLTDRERQIVELLAKGEARSVIAQKLYISPATVRTHIQRAMAKLEVHSQNELMALLAPLDDGT